MAANRIKGITIEIGGDTTELYTALKVQQRHTVPAERRWKAAEIRPRQRGTAGTEAETAIGRRFQDKGKAGYAENRRWTGEYHPCKRWTIVDKVDK